MSPGSSSSAPRRQGHRRRDRRPSHDWPSPLWSVRPRPVRILALPTCRRPRHSPREVLCPTALHRTSAFSPLRVPLGVDPSPSPTPGRSAARPRTGRSAPYSRYRQSGRPHSSPDPSCRGPNHRQQRQMSRQQTSMYPVRVTPTARRVLAQATFLRPHPLLPRVPRVRLRPVPAPPTSTSSPAASTSRLPVACAPSSVSTGNAPADSPTRRGEARRKADNRTVHDNTSRKEDR